MTEDPETEGAIAACTHDRLKNTGKTVAGWTVASCVGCGQLLKAKVL